MGKNWAHRKEECNQYPPFKDFMEFVFKEAKIACFSVTSFQTIKSEQSSMEFDKYGKKLNNNFPHLQTMEAF